MTNEKGTTPLPTYKEATVLLRQLDKTITLLERVYLVPQHNGLNSTTKLTRAVILGPGVLGPGVQGRTLVRPCISQRALSGEPNPGWLPPDLIKVQARLVGG